MGTVHAKSIESTQSERDQRDISLGKIQAYVERVHIEGLARTKDDIIESCVKSVFNAKTFQEVIIESNAVRNKLVNLGCFRSIKIHIDTSKASPHGYEVTFLVQEMKRIAGGVNTLVGGNNEGSLLINMKSPNLFGRGETIQGEYSYGSKKTQVFNVSFIKPLVSKYNTTVTASAFQNEQEWPISGYKLTNRGILADLMFNSLPKVKHNIQWEGTIRELNVGNRYASFDVREDAGSTLKSCVRHILTVDSRDSTIFPNFGTLAQLTTEFAGLGGNIGFLKNEVFFQSSIPLVPDIILQASFSGGLLSPLTSEKKRVVLCDNFFLGGPLSLRGFQMRGVGPVSDGSFLGAKAYWSAALHLYTPLPFRPGAGGFGELFRTHLFVNTGNIGDFEKPSDMRQLLLKLTEHTRLVYGIGLAVRLGHIARLELNYCIPVLFKDTDSVVRGVQFGVGVQFL